MELLMLGLIWRSMPYTDVLVFAPDLPMSKYVMIQRCVIYLSTSILIYFIIYSSYFIHLNQQLILDTLCVSCYSNC